MQLNPSHTWSRALRLAPILGLLAAGCSSGDSDTVIVTPGPSPQDTFVVAEQFEFGIALDRFTAPPGLVTFEVTNTGGMMHEFLIVGSDFAADDMPVDIDGAYVENAPGTEVIDVIEDILPGETVEITLDLPPDHYVVMCNMVMEMPDGSFAAHYDLGMFEDFDVIVGTF
jgi:hypothetical protein